MGKELNSGDKHCRTLISGFRRDVYVICGLLGDYTASWGNYLPFWVITRRREVIIYLLGDYTASWGNYLLFWVITRHREVIIYLLGDYTASWGK
jgi:hypothetical protein